MLPVKYWLEIALGNYIILYIIYIYIYYIYIYIYIGYTDIVPLILDYSLKS